MKNYPLVARCLNSGALEVLLMEGMETKDIILCLLKLELRHGPITMISRDSGTNLLTNNINPKLASGDEMRLLGNIKDYTARPDAQFLQLLRSWSGNVEEIPQDGMQCRKDRKPTDPPESWNLC